MSHLHSDENDHSDGHRLCDLLEHNVSVPAELHLGALEMLVHSLSDRLDHVARRSQTHRDLRDDKRLVSAGLLWRACFGKLVLESLIWN